MLDTISSERIRYDLELILKEELPEKILKRAYQLGVLKQLFPSLRGNSWLAHKFEQARQLGKKKQPLPLYFALLIYPLTEAENEQFLTRINPPKKLASILLDTQQIKKQSPQLSTPYLEPSRIYHILREYQPAAIQANAIATESSVVHQHLELFLHKLRYVKPLLNGDDLKAMGIPFGPKLGAILKSLHEAKLNGKVRTRKDEEKLIRILRYK